MAEQPPEKVLDLIRRLLALSTSSNEHEAGLAAAKAQELLLKHNLEMSQIHQEEGNEVERWDFKTSVIEPWLDLLCSAVSRANLCRVVKGYNYAEGTRIGNTFIPGRKYREYNIFGRRPNLEVTEFMYCYLADEIDRLTPKKKGVRYKNDFRIGAVNTINTRMQEELKTFQNSTETRALIVTDTALVDSAVKDAFPKLYAGRKITVGNTGGYQDGQAAGKSIQFRQGVANRSPVGQGLLT